MGLRGLAFMGHDCRLETDTYRLQETQPMSAALETLDRLNTALAQSQNGQLPQSEMIRLWRTQGASLALPARFDEVLQPLLDRIEASALFSEESCSFSQKDLFASLQLWADKARLRLSSQGAAQP
jgi:hypothetical protein